MEAKDVDTTESLNSDNTVHQHLISYGRELTEQQLIVLAISRLDPSEESFEENAICHVDQLQQTLEMIDKSKTYTYQSHNAADKIGECARNYSAGERNHEPQAQGESIETHSQFISGASVKISVLLGKIGEWRNKRQLVERMRARALRINGLIRKKYNMRNYAEQMELVRGMVQRVSSRLAGGDCDHRFLEELMSRQLIPYRFYRSYAYSVVYQVLSARLRDGSLVILRQNHLLPDLLAHMRNFFTADLYANCQQFLRLVRHVRIISQQGIALEDGFAHLFRPFFLRILEEEEQIDCTAFLKARSLMQSSPLAIEVWREYEEAMVEKYVLWSYEQHNSLRQSELIHLAELKQAIALFKQRHQWISLAGLRSSKIHGSNFPCEFLKAALLKVVRPVLTRLFADAFPPDRLKSFENFKQEFQDYWFYCVFGKHRSLYHFIGHELRAVLNAKSLTSNRENLLEEGELNIDQYYKYYQQIHEILTEELENKDIGREFGELWRECWLRITSGQQSSANANDFNQFSHIRILEGQLEQCLAKKGMPKEERAEAIYGLVMNLNLNSCRFFLLREGLKWLDKSGEREIKMIREVAYQHLYG